MHFSAEIQGFFLGFFRPALDGDAAIPDINAHGDLFPVPLHGGPQKRLIGDSRRPQDYPVDPGKQVPVNDLHASDAAADLAEEAGGFLDGAHGFKIRCFAAPGALQVHQMDAGRPLPLKVQGNFHRVFVIDGHLGVVAFIQADSLSFK